MAGELKPEIINEDQVREELFQAGVDWQVIAVSKIDLLEQTAEPEDLGQFPSKNPEVVAFMDGYVKFLYSWLKDAGQEIDYEVIDWGCTTIRSTSDNSVVQSGLMAEFGVSLAKNDKISAAQQFCARNGILLEEHRQSVLLAIADNFVKNGINDVLADVVDAYNKAHPDSKMF